MADRLEPSARIFLPGGRLSELGCLLTIVLVFLDAAKLSDLLGHRGCFSDCSHGSSDTMDHRSCSSISIREVTEERRALVVMPQEREPHKYSRWLCFDMYPTGTSTASIVLDSLANHSQEAIKYLAVLITVVELLLLACLFGTYRITRTISRKLEESFT